MEYDKNKIKEITNIILDELGESINNEIWNKFGSSIDSEELEEINNIVWDEIIKEII